MVKLRDNGKMGQPGELGNVEAAVRWSCCLGDRQWK